MDIRTLRNDSCYASILRLCFLDNIITCDIYRNVESSIRLTLSHIIQAYHWFGFRRLATFFYEDIKTQFAFERAHPMKSILVPSNLWFDSRKNETCCNVCSVKNLFLQTDRNFHIRNPINFSDRNASFQLDYKLSRNM